MALTKSGKLRKDVKCHGIGSGGRFRIRTHCQNGHLYTPETTRYLKNSPAVRQCRVCDKQRAQACADKRKRDVFAAYGNKCAWPGCEICDPDMLTLDHVNDDGHKDRHSTGRKAGGFMYVQVMCEGCPKDRYQLLCANHNQKKEMLRRRALRAQF